MRVTVEDVAKLAGVSRATACRALGAYGYVGEAARTKVLEAASQLKYSPHAIAKSMVTGRTRTVGLVVGDIENPFFASVARGVSDAITPEGYNLIVCSTNESLKDEAMALEGLYRKQVDGLIIAPVSSTDGGQIKDLVKRGVPVVLVDRPLEGVDVDFVAVANSEGAYEGVRHLLQRGHRRVGFLGDSITTTGERLEGYRRALSEAGVPVDESLIRIGAYSVESGYRGAVSLLSGTPGPTAVFAASNFMTTGLLMAVKDMQLRIPGQVAIVSFDDMDWLKLISPGITAVAQPVYELGRVSGQHLLRRIAGDTKPRETTWLSTRLIVRESAV